MIEFQWYGQRVKLLVCVGTLYLSKVKQHHWRISAGDFRMGQSSLARPFELEVWLTVTHADRRWSGLLLWVPRYYVAFARPPWIVVWVYWIHYSFEKVNLTVDYLGPPLESPVVQVAWRSEEYLKPSK